MTGHLAYCLSRKRGELSLWKLEQGVLSNTWICHPSIYFCFEALLDNNFFHLKPRNTCGHWTTWNQLWANWNDDVGLVSQFLRHAPGKKYLHCETIQPCMSFSMGNHHINGTNYFPNTYEKRKSRLGNWIPAHREHPSILQKKMHTYFGIIPRRPWKHISLRLLPVKHSYVGCKPQSIQGIWYGALASASGCIA
jgi:hypothetical protein